MSPTEKATQVNIIVHHLIIQSTRATPEQLREIVDHMTTAPFATDLLEVDQVLWGSFWHGDVISPGIQLPAVELALLRATRLDGYWPEETTVEEFLADLRRAVRHPRAGIWTLTVAGEPCVVFATADQALVTVVWYCATTGHLHAGYRTTTGIHFGQAMEQRIPKYTYQTDSTTTEIEWLAQTVKSSIQTKEDSLTARLDAEILRIRLAGLKSTDR